MNDHRRRFAIGSIVLLTLFAFSCSSNNIPVQLTPPQFQVRQVSTVGHVARHIAGDIPVQFSIDVMNPSAETITLYQIRLDTLGMGAYTLRPTQKPFNTSILPDHVETVELWAPAIAENTIVGLNGPVTLRGVAYFRTQYGSFQHIFIQQLNDGNRGQRDPE
ncbi:MAG TPA: hypothetical protein VMT00_16990 [Thermoanaerobaculia bacterium]|nr:hypothetical protein [Thermoanaerobaculia bacterium]